MRCAALLAIAALLVLASPARAIDSETQGKIEKYLYPVARLIVGQGSGSGTVIFSASLTEEGQVQTKIAVVPRRCTTFVLTANHVINGAVSVTHEYDPSLKKEIPVERRQTVRVDLFEYENGSYPVGQLSLDGNIDIYTAQHDLALVRLKSERCFPYVSPLYPLGADPVQVTQDVWAVGAALGHDPIPTQGIIEAVDLELEGETYIMSSAPIIFGNSGGALFLAPDGYLIGVPTMVNVVSGFLSVTPITHLSFVVPYTTIYDWLEAEDYDWLWGVRSYEEAMRARAERIKREQAEQ